jgi:hypothetical protein
LTVSAWSRWPIAGDTCAGTKSPYPFVNYDFQIELGARELAAQSRVLRRELADRALCGYWRTVERSEFAGTL